MIYMYKARGCFCARRPSREKSSSFIEQSRKRGGVAVLLLERVPFLFGEAKRMCHVCFEVTTGHASFIVFFLEANFFDPPQLTSWKGSRRRLGFVVVADLISQRWYSQLAGRRRYASQYRSCPYRFRIRIEWDIIPAAQNNWGTF